MPASAPHVSDSAAQRHAETKMLTALANRYDLDFSKDPKRLEVLNGLQPDGIDWTRRVLVEAYARVGKLKGAQPHKVKGDILKMLLIERRLGGNWRKILCFGSADAARVAKGKSWVAVAAKEFGVEVEVVSHSRRMKKALLVAQKRQRMVNSQ